MKNDNQIDSKIVHKIKQSFKIAWRQLNGDTNLKVKLKKPKKRGVYRIEAEREARERIHRFPCLTKTQSFRLSSKYRSIQQN